MALPNPTIVVPGITANYLQDDYLLPAEIIWSVMTKNYERAALHPDNLKFEAAEPARVRPAQLYEIVYRELIEEIRFNLSDRPDRPVPVFPFAYDWRQPLDAIEQQLAQFVDEVIERTKLLKHYHAEGYGEAPKVNLVGHSMGGLVIAGYLQGAGKKSRVGKVATLATPFRGSFESVIKIVTGTANLGTEAPSSREREAARMTPALYHLLPSFPNGMVVPEGFPRTLFDPALWQPSVLDTIAQYVKLRGLNPTGASSQAKALFAAMLTAASDHRKRIEGFKLADAGLAAADWLCVVGVNTTTRVRLEVVKKGKIPDFNFQSADRQDHWQDSDLKLKRLTGDGTVPFEGAIPGFLALENLVCVTPDDYGYWEEVGDRVLSSQAGFHGILPAMDMLHRLIVRHFSGRPDKHGNTWGRPAPAVTQWQPPIAGLKSKSS